MKHHTARTTIISRSLLTLAVLVAWGSAGFAQVVEISSEDFESTPEFSLPAGWTEENWTDPSSGTNIGDSDDFLTWTVVTEQTLGQISGDRLNVPSVVDGKSVYAESDVRDGYQTEYLYTPVFDLRTHQHVMLAFDSNYVQNQDNIDFAEYTLQGNLDNNEAKTWLPIFYWVDAEEVAAAAGNVEDLFWLNFINDDNFEAYAYYTGADFSLVDFDKHIEGRGNDDMTGSKRHEIYSLPQAGGQQYVQIRFAQCAAGSWYWGIDNFKLLEYPSFPPEKPVLTSSSDAYQPGEDVVLTGSTFSDPEGDTHASSTWVVSASADLSGPSYQSVNDTANLTSITIPADALEIGHRYYARVEYTDSTGVSSRSNTVSFILIKPNVEYPEGAYFYADFDGVNTAALVSLGWDLNHNEWAAEVGTDFVVAPEYPVRPPNSDTSSVSPPTVTGEPSQGGYLISDSDAASGSDDVDSYSEFWAITPSFSTEGSTEVWFHADVDIENNNNGECVVELAVSTDGGNTWVPVWQDVEPQRCVKGVAPDERTEGFPILGSGSHTKTWDGIHGRWHVKLDPAVNQSDVRLRIEYFEPADAWWIAVDNILVDSVPPPAGSDTLLTEDFENGIPDTWTNTPLATQVWGTEPLKNEAGEYIRNVDLLRAAELAGVVIDPEDPGADPDYNPNGATDGRWLLMLAGQGYAMWQDNGDANTAEAATLDTPPIDCSGFKDVFLDFDSEFLWGSSGNSKAAEVWVSVDGGKTFDTRLFTYTAALMNSDECPYYDHHYLEAPTAAGRESVIFRFSADSTGAPGSSDGFWVIDNVRVTGNPGAPVVQNLPPAAPTVEPIAGAQAGQPVTLVASPFADPDEGNTHKASTWQVASDEGFENLVFESANDEVNLTTITIPAGALPAGSFYYARVQYIDQDDAIGGFSEAISFGIPGAGVVGAFFSENFNGKNDANLLADGWTISNTPQATETATWTSETHRDDTNPPRRDGLPTSGNYIISDSDAASGSNPTGTGASHDIVTPNFSTIPGGNVWLHMNVSAVLNNNGEAIFDIDVSTDGGHTFVNQYRCIAPERDADPLAQPGFTAMRQTGGMYGHVDIRLPAADNQPNVRVRFRHFEPNDDWWIAIDDIVVNDIPPERGTDTLLSEDFENGIPATWTLSSNTSEGWSTQNMPTRVVDSVQSGNGPSDLDGRTLNNLAGQGYVISQMGELSETVSTLDTPAIDCSGFDHVFLQLDSEYLANGGDVQRIQVSVDGGQTFTNLFEYQLALQNTEEDAWFNHFTFPVQTAAGKNAVVFRFYSAGADPGENEGFWAIDNVRVIGGRGAGRLPFTENFDGKTDADLIAEGWTMSDTPQAVETATWTSEVRRDDTNPPRRDGLPTSGNYIISDSDAASGDNPTGSGASHDVLTPSFSAIGAGNVWLHMNVSAVLNNNGEAVFDIDVSTDGGNTFVNQYRCIAPERDAEPLAQPGFTATQQTGGMYGHVDIRLPAADNQPSVRIRFRHFEPSDDWWIAIDDIVVDDVPPPHGAQTLLSEGFDNGIPATWTLTSNTAEGWSTQNMPTRVVDSVLSGNGPSDLDGRTLNNLAGQGYVISQMGEVPETVSTLDTPALDCSNFGVVFLQVDSEYLANGGDVQRIQVSVDGGLTFTNLFEYQLALQNAEEDAWFDHFTFVVPEAAGKSSVIFRFYSAGADPGENEGFWAIDNVRVTASGAGVLPAPIVSMKFDQATVEDAGFVYSAAAGLNPGRISLGNVPAGGGTDGRGLILDAGPGEGILAISTTPIPVGSGPVLISVAIQANGPGCSAGLAALNSTSDGALDWQMGYAISSGDDIPVGSWGPPLLLLYDPPSDYLQPAIQVAVPASAPGVTVYFDNLTVYHLPPLGSELVTLDADGTFEAGPAGMFQNVNQRTGQVDFTSVPGEVVLSIVDTDVAANVGIVASSLQGGFPHLLQATVDAQLLSGSGGVTALVMTNGNANVGTFVNNSTLPGAGEAPASIMIGGGFQAENAAFPILNVVQNGGPGVTSAVVLDNLAIRRILSVPGL